MLEGKAWEASTSRGVPTHRKRLRPAERVETESASDRAVETCEVHGPPASPAGQNGANSAENCAGDAKVHGVSIGRRVKI